MVLTSYEHADLTYTSKVHPLWIAVQHVKMLFVNSTVETLRK